MKRVHHDRGRHDGETTLVQTFRFAGDVESAAIAESLLAAPLLGLDSVFGERPGQEDSTAGPARRLRGFSPAPGFRFDVELAASDPNTFVVTFSQPDRTTPYLEGDLVWIIRDSESGPELHEEINTELARSIADRPLSGPRPSLRRSLFFRIGHAQVMAGAAANLELLARSA